MTGWNGQQVLYFGDHPYSDLADVTLQHGWRTGAIISELAVSWMSLKTDPMPTGLLSARNKYFELRRL
jgi:hypothetical protein